MNRKGFELRIYEQTSYGHTQVFVETTHFSEVIMNQMEVKWHYQMVQRSSFAYGKESV